MRASNRAPALLVPWLVLLGGCDVVKQIVDDRCCCYPVTGGSADQAFLATSDECAKKGADWICGSNNPYASPDDKDLYRQCEKKGSRLGPELPPHVAEGAVVRFVAFADDQPDAGACIARCGMGIVNASCTSAEAAPPVVSGLGTLRSRVATVQADSLLGGEELRGMFGLGDDPCGRGPTAFLAPGLVNIGGPCTIETTLADAKVRIRLDIPIVLSGRWVTKSAALLHVAFEGRDTAPSISFWEPAAEKRHALDRDFGGQILGIEADSQRILAKTNGGCMGVILSKEQR